MGIWWSSNHWSTPICARPSAPPPSRATPILSLFFVAAGSPDEGAVEASEAWGNARGDRRKHNAIAAKERRKRVCIGCPGRAWIMADFTLGPDRGTAWFAGGAPGAPPVHV